MKHNSEGDEYDPLVHLVIDTSQILLMQVELLKSDILTGSSKEKQLVLVDGLISEIKSLAEKARMQKR